MKNKVTAIIATILISVFYGSCGPKDAEKESAESKSQQTNTVTNEDDAYLKKYNAYIDLYNIEKDLYLLTDDYFEHVGYETYNSKYAKNINSSYSSEIQKKMDFAIEMNEKEPKMETDKMVRELVETMQPLFDKLKDIYKYYDDEENRNNSYPKGKVLHKEVVSLYEKFTEISNKFEAVIVKMADESTNREVEKMKAKGFLFTAAQLKSIFAIQKINDYLVKNNISAINAYKIKMSDFNPLQDNFTACVKELEQYSEDAQVLKLEGINSKPTHILSTANEIQKNISEIVDMANKGERSNYNLAKSFQDFNTNTSYFIDIYNKQL